MKRTIFSVAAAVLCACACLAGASAHALVTAGSNQGTAEVSNVTRLEGSAPLATSYIGVYGDSARTITHVEPEMSTEFDVWIWCRADNGIIAAEYVVSYPSSIVRTGLQRNPAINVELGSIESGITVSFGTCQNGWTYTHHLKFMTLDNSPGTIEIAPAWDTGEYLFATCGPGYPVETPVRLTRLYVNSPCIDDHLPPYIVESIRPLSTTEFEARYTEPVTEESAENLANYYVCDLGCATNIPIAGVTLLADQRTISVSLGSPISQGIEYFFGYTKIRDLCGNILDWTNVKNFGYIPDLVVSNASADPDSIYLETPTIEVKYKIKNSGNWPSGPFDATILWYRGTPDTVTAGTVSYGGLAAGDSLVDSIQIAVPAILTSRNELRCWVDYPRHVTELSETNNVATRSIYVFLPDLSIYYNNVVMEPAAVSDGCTAVRLRYHIDNLGPVDAGPFPATIELQMNRSPQPERRLIATVQYPGVASGASLVDSFTTVLPSDLADNNAFTVTANAPHGFVEITYNNNPGVVTFGNYAPCIVSIEDVPNDGGGFVTLQFYRSRNDAAGVTNPVIRYDIMAVGSGAIVGTVAATRSQYYANTVPTIADSTSGDIVWSIYRVRAVRPVIGAPDTLYYSSCPDSGYSINNQISTLLQSYSASLKESCVELAWALAGGSDTPEFIILRENRARGGFVALSSSGPRAERGDYTFIDSEIEPGESYRYRIEYMEAGSQRLLFETEFIDVPPRPLTLYQNLPNPFNPSTTISFYLPEAGPVRLEVFDVRGSRVATLVNGRKDKGTHSVEWNGVDGRGGAVGSGIYFYRLVAGKASLSRKMILLR